MKKCTKCGEKKLFRESQFKHTFYFEGKKVPVILCELCTQALVIALLDLIDYRYYRTMLEKFGGKSI